MARGYYSSTGAIGTSTPKTRLILDSNLCGEFDGGESVSRVCLCYDKVFMELLSYLEREIVL
jgi:hypothetical protein